MARDRPSANVWVALPTMTALLSMSGVRMCSFDNAPPTFHFVSSSSPTTTSRASTRFTNSVTASMTRPSEFLGTSTPCDSATDASVRRSCRPGNPCPCVALSTGGKGNVDVTLPRNHCVDRGLLEVRFGVHDFQPIESPRVSVGSSEQPFELRLWWVTPGQAAFDDDRAKSIAQKIVADSDVRHQLFPNSDDARIAQALAEVYDRTISESANNFGGRWWGPPTHGPAVHRPAPSSSSSHYTRIRLLGRKMPLMRSIFAGPPEKSGKRTELFLKALRQGQAPLGEGPPYPV